MESSKKTERLGVKKKPTAYVIRKERRRQLMEQANKLQELVDELKFRQLVKQGEVDKNNRRLERENALLKRIIQEQHIAFVAALGALNGHVQRSLSTLQPGQTMIHLGVDREVRHKALMELKDNKLDYAQRYLAARSHGLNPLTSHCQEERFDSRDGDYCYVRFENQPIRGANVSEVFHAILESVMNAEMFLSEMFGNISVREDNEFEDAESSQIRLASATSVGTIVESNAVLFSKLQSEAGGGFGVMAIDFVDTDDLFPYNTETRVRADATSLVTARSLPNATRGTESDVTKIGMEQPEVVVTRWTYLKIHRSNSNLSQDPEIEMKESSICWGDTAKRCVEQQLVHATTMDTE
ncbi:uncharacterized protein IUM83_03448 [Phytophthora cinnamomi]|uniref:uncharacterized protein n=1 Tax=Phytophthora cinnamomi TaxID=4785 RepID=UPI00355AB866|nr:hypothetical protein IUM83_03448 [Phytophthora cinnamomi]